MAEERNSVDIYLEIYEFAASAGALEGYVFQRADLNPDSLNNWVKNLVKQYHALPVEAKESFQGSLDRTLGRAILSLITILGQEHDHVRSLKSLIVGKMPDSPQDFEMEKRAKSEKYGE